MHPTARQSSTGPRLRLFLTATTVAVVAVLIDQGTKTFALAELSETERLPLFGELLGLQLTFNPGAVMSFGANATWVFTILATAASFVLLIAATRARSAGWASVVGLIWGGALGNLCDRLFAPPGFGVGHVTDFVAYGTLFIGNLADIFLGVGVGIGLLLHWRGQRATRDPEPVTEGPTSPQPDSSLGPAVDDIPR